MEPSGAAAAVQPAVSTPVEGAVEQVPGGAAVARPVAVRRRRRQTTPRPHAVSARFSDEEFEALAEAAAAAGVTPTSYVASSAVALARGQVRPMPAGIGDVMRELVDARTQLVRYGVLLNQAVARLNATGQVDGSLVAAAQRCDAAMSSLRSATERLGRPR